MTKLIKSTVLMSVVFMILNSCANPNQRTMTFPSSQPASPTFIEIVNKGYVKALAKILQRNPALEIKDEEGRTPLMIAAYKADNEIAKMLIDAGANVNAQDKMLNSAFLYAGASGNVDLLKWCLASKPDFRLYNRYGGTALIPAAEKGHLEIVQILSNIKDYPIDHINKLGWTALLEAIILSEANEKQTEIVKVLVQAGANVNIADKNGISPLKHAQKRNLNAIEKILTAAGGI